MKWLEEGSFSVVSEKSFTDVQPDKITVGDVHNIIYKKKSYEAKIDAVGKLNHYVANTVLPWLFFLLLRITFSENFFHLSLLSLAHQIV